MSAMNNQMTTTLNQSEQESDYARAVAYDRSHDHFEFLDIRAAIGNLFNEQILKNKYELYFVSPNLKDESSDYVYQTLFDVYLTNIPGQKRQSANCDCCREFIDYYGRLVFIDENQKLTSALWSIVNAHNLPGYYHAAISKLKYAVENKSTIIGRFYAHEKNLGVDVNVGFKSIVPGLKTTHANPLQRQSLEFRHYHAVLTNEAYTALVIRDFEKDRDYDAKELTDNGKNLISAQHGRDGQVIDNVIRNLYQITTTALNTAVELIKTDSMAGAEKMRPQIYAYQKLRKAFDEQLHQKMLDQIIVAENKVNPKTKEEYVYLNVNRAASAYEKVARFIFHNTYRVSPVILNIGSQSSMVLLNLIKEGKSINFINKVMKDLFHGLNYQRSTQNLNDNQISEADAYIAQIGIRSAMDRRMATKEEVKKFAVWQASSKQEEISKPATNSLHAVLSSTAKKDPYESLPRMDRGDMTWYDFQRLILPQAKKIFLINNRSVACIGGFTVPTDAEHNPMYVWDTEEKRLPEAPFRFQIGLPVSLLTGTQDDVEIEQIVKMPWMNLEDKPDYNAFTEHEKEGSLENKFGIGFGYILKDSQFQGEEGAISGDLFTACMHSFVHRVRAVLDQYGQKVKIPNIKDKNNAFFMMCSSPVSLQEQSYGFARASEQKVMTTTQLKVITDNMIYSVRIVGLK